MNKKEFLKELELTLKKPGTQSSEIREVLDDYEAMITEALLEGEDETTFIEGLGRPSKIVKSLNLQKTQLQKNKEKIIGISPFVAIMIFFLVGFLFNGFMYSWLAFLLIPVTAILLEENGVERILGLSVFGALFIYFGIGFGFQLWHPGWIVFLLLIPVGLWGEKKSYPLILTIASLSLIGVYTFLEFTQPSWINYFVLVPLIPIALFSGVLKIEFGDFKGALKEFVLGALVLLMFIGVYLYIGFAFGGWHPGWLIFMLLPIIALLYSKIYKNEKTPLVSYMPFISVILFILIGEIWNGYAYSWLAFLLIPMVGVLSEKGE